MQLNKIKYAIALMLAILTITACKKTGISVDGNEAADVKAKAIKATIERYGRVTAPVIFQPMQPASFISYKDANGNSIQYGGTGRTTATCGQYTCATAPNASDLYVTYTLEYVKWYYTCWNSTTDEHDLTAMWKVSAPYTLLLQDGSSNYSYGNIRIKTTGGTVLTTSGNLGNGNLTITSLGTDPNCSSNTLYSVTYTWHDVADTYFPDNIVECSFTIYNNCAITNNNTSVGYTFGATFTNLVDVFTYPCDRIDQAWVNPATSGQTYTTVSGAYVVCTPPSGFIGTDYHQVEYRAVTHGSSRLWDDQNSNVTLGKVPGSGTPGTDAPTVAACCDVIELRLMVVNSGQWLIRYRNMYSTTCQQISGIGSPWGENYFTEYWNLP